MEIDTYQLILKQVTMTGYVVGSDAALRAEWAQRFAAWLRSGAIQFPHTRVEGIEQAPQAFHDALAGRYLGTVVVAICREEPMRISDAAAAAETTPRALRFYEANGLLPAPRRTRPGQRVYRPAELARLRVIRELLGLGLTVADIRGCADRLDLLDGDTLPPYGGPGVCSQATGIVQRRIAALDAEIGRLTALRDQLAARIAATPAPR